MAQAFLSYARKDDEQLGRVLVELDRAGITYWVDQRDIPVSVPWFEEVREAILGSSLFVVCESFRWFESQACRIEKVTADSLGKQIVHIDVIDQPPAEAAEAIARSLAAQTDGDRVHTDLLIRSSAWERAGRAGHDLVGGKVLRALRTSGKDKTRPLTSEARSFLDASIRRHRRRATLSRLGALVVGVAVLTVITFDGAQRKSAKDFADAAKAFSDVAAIHDRTERDIYDGLRTASALVHSGNSGFMSLTVLQDALDVPLPDRSTELPGPPPVGFGAGVADGEPVVFGGDGHRWSAGPDWEGPISTVTADDRGNVVVAGTSAGPVAMINGRRVRVPCSGTAAAVSPIGATVATVDRHSVCIWRPGEEAVRKWTADDGQNLAVTDDYIMIGDNSGKIGIFTLAGTPVAVVPGIEKVTGLAVSADGGHVAIVRSGQANVEIRDVATGRLYRALPAGARAQVARFAPDGRTIAVGQGESVQLWDLATGVLKTRLAGGTGILRTLAWSADGADVWALSERRLTRWPWRLGTQPYNDPATWFVGLSAPGPDGHLIATTQSGALIDINPATSTTTPIAQTGGRKVVTAAVDTLHTTAALGAANTLILHEFKTGGETNVGVDDCTPVSTEFIPGKPLVVVACNEGDALTVDTRNPRVAARTVIPYGGASAVAVGPGGEVYVSSVTGVVHQTDASFTNLRVIYAGDKGHSHFQDIAVSADGNTMALVGDGTGSVGHTLVGTRGDDGNWAWYALLLPNRPGQQSRAVVISSDGTLGAIGLSDGTVEYWIPRNADPGFIYTEAPGAVRGISFTAPGDKVVAVTRDGAVDVLPGCPSCGNASKLADDADSRLASAVRMGLTAR